MNLHVSTLFGAFSCLPAAFFWTAFNRLQFYQPHIVVVHGGAVYCSAMQTILLFIMPQILGYIQSIPTILSHYIYILGQCLFSVSQNHTVCVQYFTFAFLVQYSIRYWCTTCIWTSKVLYNVYASTTSPSAQNFLLSCLPTILHFYYPTLI